MTEKPVYWVYMLRLDNGSYYTGYTRDLEKRVRDHRRGRGSKITRSFAPVAVAACWRLRCGKSAAMRLEAWIKSRTRQVKQSLVEHPESLPELRSRRGREEPVEPVVPPPAMAPPDRPDTQGAAEGAAARAYRPPPAAPPHPPAGSAARRPADPIDQF